MLCRFYLTNYKNSKTFSQIHNPWMQDPRHISRKLHISIVVKIEKRSLLEEKKKIVHRYLCVICYILCNTYIHSMYVYPNSRMKITNGEDIYSTFNRFISQNKTIIAERYLLHTTFIKFSECMLVEDHDTVQNSFRTWWTQILGQMSLHKH